MSNKYKMDCGCEFDIYDSIVKTNDGLPSLSLDFTKVRMDCPLAWSIFHIGRTKGVFQLENKLGQDWSAAIKPIDLDELSAVISVIRPGTLKSKLNDKSLTRIFAERKNGLETVSYVHPALEPILSKTYGILVYQEQAMKIATDLAGFNLQEADTLRKAIGKKNAELMSKVEKEFIAKSKTFGVIDEDITNTIFGWIRESQKYSFNKSHGVSYGKIGYLCAYAKAHFPIQFFTSSLFYAKDKQYPQEEIEALIEDAMIDGINICPPTLKHFGKNVDITHFYCYDKNVYFGVSDIKGIGNSAAEKLKDKLTIVEKELDKKVENWTWYEFLIHLCDNITSTVVQNLIDVGGLDFIDNTRSRERKKFEYNIYKSLDSKEKSYIRFIDSNNLGDAMRKIVSDPLLKRSENRKKVLLMLSDQYNNSPYSTKDSMHTIIVAEEKLLGVPVSISRINTCLTKGSTMCNEIQYRKDKSKATLACEIINVREHLIKKANSKAYGKTMAFVKVKDESGTFDGVCVFSDEYEQFSNLLYKSNTVLLEGSISEKNNTKSFIVKEVKQI